jgi:pimeloyl-ACP methyl ester carboxylesterase
MHNLDGIFDRSGAVPRPPYAALWREEWSLLTYRPPAPDPAAMPAGRGHVVLVMPAFLTTDGVTRSLRRFLERCGYRAFGWELGVNWGPTPYLLEGLRRRLRQLRALEGGPISLVGVSLGGLLARDLAYDCAADIRRVVTLVSPFHLPTASTIELLIRIAARFYAPDFDFRRLSSPLPVPSTAVFTRDDGIVAWQSCFSDAAGDSVEVAGPHITICRNPEALRVTAERLARSPFETPADAGSSG